MGRNFSGIFSEERREMLSEQLISRGIEDKRVLEVMGKVPREEFVAPGERVRSYCDGPLPIGNGQTISQPYIVAYMTEMLELTGSENILELGTGSGYQTAVLAEIVKEVSTIELIPELAGRSEELLTKKLGYTNIRFKIGNGAEGWNEYAPFKRIIVTAAPEVFPELLFDQLEEGGMIIAPVGGFSQNLMKYKKINGEILRTGLIAVSFVPLIV